ncbi:MAG: hypothetical protein U0271_34505 [Polyangiaceae bacterium]
MSRSALARMFRFLALVALAATLIAGTSAAAPAKAFIPEKPPARTQVQKTPDERGGVNPCNTKEPPPGVYGSWDRATSIGQMIMPVRGGVTKDGKFDLVIHFHGHDPVRREFVKVMDGAVLVGITLGIGSGVYEQTFANPAAFTDLIASTEKEVAKLRGLKKAKVRRLALSAWSAGYGAVESILRQKSARDMVDAVILLDGLHTGYNPDGTLERSGLEPFIEFAKRAKAGKRFMYVSHSSIIPPGYASTTETVNYLIHELGGKPKSAKPRKGDPMGLDLNSKFDSGNFHARGFDGNDKMDHCAHIGLIREVMKAHLKKRWKTPKGFGPKKDGSDKGAPAVKKDADADKPSKKDADESDPKKQDAKKVDAKADKPKGGKSGSPKKKKKTKS